MGRVGYFDGAVIKWGQPFGPVASPAKPVITSQPTNVTVATGQVAAIVATATNWTGVRAEYQDDLGATQVAATEPVRAGDTATYNTNNAGPWHNGRKYRLVFLNANGETPTNWVTVTVGTGGGDPPVGSFTDGVLWLPTTVNPSPTPWGRHTQSGHEQTDLLVVNNVNGRPAFPYLCTNIIHHEGDRFPVGGGHRTEWRPFMPGGASVDQVEGREYWIGWFFYLPPGYPNPEASSWGRIMGQMHGGSGSPTWAIRHDPNGSLMLDLRGGAENANLRQLQLLPTIQRDHVYKLKMHIRPSSSSSGFTRVYLDGVQRVSNNGPNKYASRGYGKWGVYGGNPGGTTRIWMGGWISSLNESDINLMHSLYTG